MRSAVSVQTQHEYVCTVPSSVAWSAAAFTKLFLCERHSMMSTTMRVPNIASSRLASHWNSLEKEKRREGWEEGRERHGKRERGGKESTAG
jgi:hypothetical protein